MGSSFQMNGQGCPTCLEVHSLKSRCSHDALVRRISKLAEANKLIPSIMKANKEATDLANTFRMTARDVSRAIAICQELILEQPGGTEIWIEFEKRLEQRWEKTSPQDTDQQHLSPGNLILSETENKLSTEETPTGGIIVLDS